MNEKTYWNFNGKYEDKLRKFEELMPDIGYTENQYMNLFIVAAHLYYDVYQNGGCSIKNCYSEAFNTYILPVLPKTFKSHLQKIIRCDYIFLEEFMNRVIEFIQDKDLQYTSFELWRKDNTISNTPVKGFTHITFGNKTEMNQWINAINPY